MEVKVQFLPKLKVRILGPHKFEFRGLSLVYCAKHNAKPKLNRLNRTKTQFELSQPKINTSFINPQIEKSKNPSFDYSF